MDNEIEKDKKLAAALLVKISKTYSHQEGMGRELFNAIAKLKVILTPEVVCLRNNQQGAMEVYLIKRAEDDSAYPGQWHIPGSAMRFGEELEDVFLRLEQKEIGLKITSKKFAFHFNNPKEARGHFFSLIYICSLEEGQGFGQWFPVTNLPENTISYHRNQVIPDAAALFPS